MITNKIRIVNLSSKSSTMLIRPINESDNKPLSVILREVLIEMQIPKKGSAYEDPELDNMFSAYQLPRSEYFVVEERGAILGGAGISPLKRWR